MIVEWEQTEKRDIYPSMGKELLLHLEKYRGDVKHNSCSAWRLLYKTLQNNNFPISKVAFTETGKPYFINYSPYFSLSHSKKLCAVAISDCPVGVDIELCRENYNQHLIERSLCDREKQVYDGDFTRLWCRKEAIAKMTGEGIVGYPNVIDTTQYCFLERMINYEGERYWLVAVEDYEIIK